MTDAFELPSTLVQALQRRAALTPDRVALRFLAETRDQAVVLSYRELDQRARTIAGALQAEAGFGERAVLLFPSGPDYVAAFFGCLYAGVIAVPAYPPESTRRHHLERLLSIIGDAEPRLVLNEQRVQHLGASAGEQRADRLDQRLGRWLVDVEVDAGCRQIEAASTVVVAHTLTAEQLLRAGRDRGYAGREGDLMRGVGRASSIR